MVVTRQASRGRQAAPPAPPPAPCRSAPKLSARSPSLNRAAESSAGAVAADAATAAAAATGMLFPLPPVSLPVRASPAAAAVTRSLSSSSSSES